MDYSIIEPLTYKGFIIMDTSLSRVTNLWDKALNEIEKRLNDKGLFESFFNGSYIYEVNESTMVIVSNSKLAKTLMENKFNQLINDVVTDLTETHFNIKFVCKDELSANEKITYVQVSKKSQYFVNAKLNPKSTFDNFVVGDFNREAHQAAILIASNPGKVFNPLFIHSNSGLGKTHLLHGIGNHIIKQGNPTSRILYITAADFVEEYIKFVTGEKEANSLKEYFNNVDVLLFDDVQFLENKTASQEFFFYAYQKLVDEGKQVVISSDRQPNELKNIQNRLITRFSQGLIVNINKPDTDSCVQILKKKITSEGLNLENIDEPVLRFFAEQFSNNIRELEGALNRLIFYAIQLKQSNRITMDVATEAVLSLTHGKALSTQLSEQKIINCVADYYNLTPNQLTGKIRTGQIALARHIAMYLIRNTLDVSLVKIGQLFGGKDHTTVMSAISKVDKELKTNQALKEAVDELSKRIKA